MPYPKIKLDGVVVAVSGGARGIDRRGPKSIEHDVRAAYEQATHAQARMAER
jgi:hypothetical protein